MTNKMPEIGKRYRRKSLGCDYQVVVENILDGRHIVCAIVPDGKTQWNRFTYQPHYFWDDYEELPDSNSLTKVKMICDKCGKDMGLADSIKYSEDGSKMSHSSCVEVNETPNPVDLEKGEVNKVEKALEELQAIEQKVR